jgi:hypothetical protein
VLEIEYIEVKAFIFLFHGHDWSFRDLEFNCTI